MPNLNANEGCHFLKISVGILKTKKFINMDKIGLDFFL